MKRSREETEILGKSGGGGGSIIDLARCLVVLSQGTGREGCYECKTCNRRFPSFQALGGHRASHKKQRQADDQAVREEEEGKKLLSLGLAVEPKKMHECSICGLEFPMGQALGGHMRRHRVEMMKRSEPYSAVPAIPVLKRSSSSKRIACLDLNLTPLENDLKLLFGEMAPKVDRFL